MSATKVEFVVEVPDLGKVQVIKQDNGDDEFFWDLLGEGGVILNEETLWEKPTREQVLTMLSK